MSGRARSEGAGEAQQSLPAPSQPTGNPALTGEQNSLAQLLFCTLSPLSISLTKAAFPPSQPGEQIPPPASPRCRTGAASEQWQMQANKNQQREK